MRVQEAAISDRGLQFQKLAVPRNHCGVVNISCIGIATVKCERGVRLPKEEDRPAQHCSNKRVLNVRPDILQQCRVVVVGHVVADVLRGD